MSPLPTQMANHWWQRPGRLPGRELYHWHILFHDQPKVHELVKVAQERLTGQSGLDLIEMRWLHLTTYIVGFADEVPNDAIAEMVDSARRRLSKIDPIPIRLGRVGYHPQAITLIVEPLRALDPILDAVRDATHEIGCEGHTDTDPWLPHISVAYSHASGPAAPIIEALGLQLSSVDIAIESVSLVAQQQVERSWQWRPVAEIRLADCQI